MNKQYSTTIGSGTVPHVAYGPVHNLSADTHPVLGSRDDLRTRVGDGVVVLNPEDFSVSVGLQATVVSVDTSATPLPAVPLENRRALAIHNNGASTIFLGGSTVTTASGFPLLAGEKIAFDIQGNTNVIIYAIAASTIDVRVLELA